MRPDKRKVADESGGGAANAMKLDLAPSPGRTRRKDCGTGGGRSSEPDLRRLLLSVGRSVETFIDRTPLGVPTPEPWDPASDPTKAMLSDPVAAIDAAIESSVCALEDTVGEAMGGLSRERVWAGAEDAARKMASSDVLRSVREGLAHAVAAEEALVVASAPGEGAKKRSDDDDGGGRRGAPEEEEVAPAATDDDDAASGGAGGGYVDLGSDRWGNRPRPTNPAREAWKEAKKLKKATMSKVLAFVDRVTLRANGIVVTSDDCSVECSLSSLVDDGLVRVERPPEFVLESVCSCGDDEEEEDDDGFEECPSVVTELREHDEEEEAEEGTEEETKDAVAAENDEIETEAQQEKPADLVSDEDDFVLTEAPFGDNEEEGFVDVGAEFAVPRGQ